MPEGHTLHRLAAQVQSLFAGRPWRVSSPQGRFASGAARLDGRAPEWAEAWGKHLLIHVGADVWQVHLGLYGAFSFRGDAQFDGAATLGAPRAAPQEHQIAYDGAGWIIPEAPQGAARARIHVPNGWADLRGPARCAVLNTVEYEQVIRRLGPDPLRQDLGGDSIDPVTIDPLMLEQFRERLSRRRVSIAAALMDQAVIAGVGNIYRAESLFVEGISPDRSAQSLGQEQVERLWSRLSAQLRDGVAEGVIRTLRENDPLLGARGGELRSPADDRPVHDYRAGEAARRGRASRRHWVYQHQGTPCLRCGETVAMRELAGRRLYWCLGCQTG